MMYVCCPHCEWKTGISRREDAGPLFAAHSNAHVIHFRRQLDEYGPEGFELCGACVGRPAGHRPCYHVSCSCACSPGLRC